MSRSAASPDLDRAVALLLAAAREVDAGAPGPAETVDPAHRWRDAAVAHAVERAWDRGDADGVRAIAASFDELLVLVPRRTRHGVELGPVGSAERRRRGSFATPPELAGALARHALPDGDRTGPVSRPPRVVDPACGAGALLRSAFARLLELGFPPGPALDGLYGVDSDPAAVTVCRTVLAVDAADAGATGAPSRSARTVRVGDALLGPFPGPSDTRARPPGDDDRVPGFPWHREFPEVLAVEQGPVEPVTGWTGGFDAVVANPPWERLKVTGKDWAGSPPERLRQARALAARTLRERGRHPLTGNGELNAYLPFMETCWRLLAPAGRAGIVVPAGVASDRSSARLWQALLENGSLERLHLLSPGAVRFTGVTSRQPVAVVVLRSGPGGGSVDPAPAQVAVQVADPVAGPGDRAWSLPPDLARLVNPNTGTPPLCASARDADLLAGAHRRWPVLHRSAPAPVGTPPDPVDWQVRMVTPLHMTNDARWFRTGPGPGLLPLWEAKHAGLLDHRGGARTDHRYWVPASLVRDRYGDLTARGWLAGYRNVTTVDSPRTLLPCALPVAGVGNSLPLLSAPRLPLLLAALASLPVDYLIRQKHAGANLNFFKLEQAAVPAPAEYDRMTPWDPGTRLGDWVLARFAAAVARPGELQGLVAELAGDGVEVPDPAGGPGRREALAELDAAHAILLGWSEASLRHVLSTFESLERRERRRHGEYRTRRLVLESFRRLGGGTGPV
jgi:hypothetical protein